MHFHIDYVPNAVVHRIGPFFKTWCAVCHAVASAVAREGGANVVSCISRFKTSTAVQPKGSLFEVLF